MFPLNIIKGFQKQRSSKYRLQAKVDKNLLFSSKFKKCFGIEIFVFLINMVFNFTHFYITLLVFLSLHSVSLLKKEKTFLGFVHVKLVQNILCYRPKTSLEYFLRIFVSNNFFLIFFSQLECSFIRYFFKYCTIFEFKFKGH